MSKRNIFYFFFSLGITFVVFYYLLTSVSVGDVRDILQGVSWNYLVMFVVLSLAGSLCRTWRYQAVLRVAGFAPATIPLFLTTLVRNLCADLLPARLGDLVYIYIGTSRLGVSFGSAASSFALAFLFDLLALVPLVVFALWSLQSGAPMSSTPFVIGGIVLAGVTSVLVFTLPSLIGVLRSVVLRLSFLSAERTTWLSNSLDSVIDSLRLARRAGIYGRLLFLSVGVRLAKYGSFYLFLCGMLIPLGYSWEQMPFPKVFLGLFASELAASLPASGIAGFGAYEGAWTATFSLLGFAASDAKLTAISHHLFTQVYGYLLGIAALLILLLPYFKREEDVTTVSSTQPEPAWSFYGKSLTTLAVVLVVLFSLGSMPSRKVRASPHAELPSTAASALKDSMLASLPGAIVFDSNRSGTFGIFTMSRSGDIVPLVDSEWHERFPAPSPDGTIVAFARSHSVARLAPSEIWTVKRDGSGAEMVNSNGGYPAFSSDGKTIYFAREREAVFAVDSGGTIERKIFPLRPGSDFPIKGAIVFPQISPNGRWLSFSSDKPDRWHTWVIDLHTGLTKVTIRACEASFWGNNSELYFVKVGGSKSGSGIYSVNLESIEQREIQDSAEPRGHEYFPTVETGQRFLLYGACPADQHDHDSANYELFAKDLHAGTVAQLTFDGFTNRWPRILSGK